MDCGNCHSAYEVLVGQILSLGFASINYDNKEHYFYKRYEIAYPDQSIHYTPLAKFDTGSRNFRFLL